MLFLVPAAVAAAQQAQKPQAKEGCEEWCDPVNAKYNCPQEQCSKCSYCKKYELLLVLRACVPLDPNNDDTYMQCQDWCSPQSMVSLAPAPIPKRHMHTTCIP
jgi:hypothetical protein